MGDDAQITPRVLVDAFGEFSDSSDEALSPTTEEDKLYIWKSVEGIDGLWLCCDFLPEKHQNLLLSAIRKGRLGLKQTGLCVNKLRTKGYTCNLFFIRIQLDPVAVGVPIRYTNRTGEPWIGSLNRNEILNFGCSPERHMVLECITLERPMRWSGRTCNVTSIESPSRAGANSVAGAAIAGAAIAGAAIAGAAIAGAHIVA